MKKISNSNGLPRRLLTFYLLFSLLSVATLVSGFLVINEMSDHRRFENHCLLLFEKYSRQAALAYQQKQTDRLQQLCETVSQEPNVFFAAVAGPDGLFVAHAEKSKIGTPYLTKNGRITTQGKIKKLKVKSDEGNVTEYSSPLGAENPGQIIVAHANRTAWLSGMELIQLFAFILVVPVGFITLGGLILYRKVKPYADINSQLVQFAASPSLELATFEKVPGKNAMSAGWNCLVEDLGISDEKLSLPEQLIRVVQSRQHGRYENAVNSLPDGIGETDLDGQITFINNAMAALLGVEDKSELIGKRLEEFLTSNDNAKTEAIFDSKSRARQVVTELEKPTKFGDRVLRIARHPIAPNSSDPHSGQAWSIRDVTQQKMADKARDDFLNSATHELRTPLSNIKAYAETLSLDDQIDIEQQKEFCNIINTEATRLSRFIDELLDVSSIEAGSLHVTLQRVEIRRLLDEVVKKVQPQMAQKDIHLETVFGEKLPELPLDKEKFSTCLVNLLGNAAKYTPENGHVEFRAQVMNGQLMISVTDNGIGIAESDLPRVFDKFYRSEDERVHDQTGTGLGLAFASEVAKLHNADLLVESKLNEGSKFTLALPIPKDRHYV